VIARLAGGHQIQQVIAAIQHARLLALDVSWACQLKGPRQKSNGRRLRSNTSRRRRGTVLLRVAFPQGRWGAGCSVHEDDGIATPTPLLQQRQGILSVPALGKPGCAFLAPILEIENAVLG
jgi:hypothetical protein